MLMERLREIFAGKVCAFDEGSLDDRLSGETGGGAASSDYESDAGFEGSGAPRRSDSGPGSGSKSQPGSRMGTENGGVRG